MTTLREAAQMALDAMESEPDVDPIFAGETITHLRAALAQPERKPLPEEEIYKLFGWYAMPFVRAIERAHGIGVEE